MRRRQVISLPALLALSLPLAARTSPSEPFEDPLQVLCTVPDLADLVSRIGGEHVEAQAIAKGTQNIHAVRLKPSHVVAASRADAFVEVGLSLEHAWVPGLLETARNADIRPGAPGFVNVSEGWTAIQVPTELSRRNTADLHPDGNPHINLDPRGGRHMARAIHAALVRLRPRAEAELDANLATYEERLDEAEARWSKLAEALRGRKVVAYHKEFDYLFRALGLELVGTVESKPGVPPTPRHIAGLVQAMRADGVEVVVTAPWSNNRSVEDLCDKTGAARVELPSMVGGTEAASDWIAMMDQIHGRLARAYGVAWPND